MDIGAWLRGLDLGRYEGVFRDNAIDAEVLPELGEEDLEKLGVLLGHRKRLLRAIAALREAAAASPALGGAAAAAHPVGPAHAERRQLTVLFADLVGSTALSARLDPEEMGELLRAYRDAVVGEIARQQGHVASFLGDGALAYFGFPSAREDDAERAVRAGLGIAAAVAGLGAPGRGEAPLAARVGIATGVVVAGDQHHHPVGEGAAGEQAVVGETPNLAARLQVLAEPGSVVVSERTRRIVGGLFACEDLGLQDLKGFATPVRAFRVVGEGRAEGRFEALRGAVPAPLVGREQELALLLERWERAEAGEGQAVLVCGEPGIGKSHLVRELRERLGGRPATSLRYQCSPQHVSSVLWPVAAQLERAARIVRGDPPAANLDRLEALLCAAGAEAAAAAAPLVADLLGLAAAPERRAGRPGLTPQQRKARTLEALLTQLTGLAARGPVLMVLEDAHWLDPTSLELFDMAVARIERLPVLLVVTFRPDFRPPWAGRGHATLLTLSRLGSRQVLAIARRVAGGRDLPAGLAEQIVEKTDGVPLFVEELTKTVLETGLLERRGGGGAVPPLAIPSTLHDSLTARLDRLAPVKAAAQVGAVIGREFSHALLAAVASLGEDELRDGLRRLIEAELLFARGEPPDAVYSFKHALVRDAAYASLLRGQRQQIHARVAAALEEGWPATGEVQPELLAHHYGMAELHETAAAWWERAGLRALERSAAAEAVALLGRAIEALRACPPSRATAERELEAQTALGGALIIASGYAAPETGVAFDRALEAAERLGRREPLVPVLYGRTLFHVHGGNLGEALRGAERLVEAAGDDATARMVAHRLMGTCHVHLGRWPEARSHLEAAASLYDPGAHDALRHRYGQDQLASALAFHAWALLALGLPDQAAGQAERSIARARSLGHPHSLAVALHLATVLFARLGAGDRLRLLGGELARLGEDGGFGFHAGGGAIALGAADLLEGRHAEAAGRIARGLAAYRAGHAGYLVPAVLGQLARAQAGLGRADEALASVGEALATARRTGELSDEPALLRLEGELLLADGGDPARGEARLEAALASARRQASPWWELRAAAALARLWAGRGEGRRARDLLGPIHARFAEGLGTPDLREAAALLGATRPPARGTLPAAGR